MHPSNVISHNSFPFLRVLFRVSTLTFAQPLVQCNPATISPSTYKSPELSLWEEGPWQAREGNT